MAGGRAEDVEPRSRTCTCWGATLYEIVTGRVPRRGNSRDEMSEAVSGYREPLAGGGVGGGAGGTL